MTDPQWEIEFDEKFNIPHWEATGYNLKYVKEFISQQIDKAEDRAADSWFKYQSEIRQEAIREVIEMIGRLPRFTDAEGLAVEWKDIENFEQQLKERFNVKD